MADYKYKNIPDPETCGIEQALIWWSKRIVPINSPLIAEKLGRKAESFDFDTSDIYAFFTLCAETVRFAGRPVLNITNIALRDGHFRVDHDGVGFGYEEIPIDRVQSAALYYTEGMFDNYGITDSAFLRYPELIGEYPFSLWAYRFVVVDFNDLKALFPPEITEPPTETAVIDPPKHPVSDSGATNAGTSNAQAEQLQWLESNADRQLPKKAIHPLFATKFPTATVRDWNHVFGKWAGTAGKAHRPLKVNK